MKPYQLIILLFFCLFLTGCSHTGLNVPNPFGGGGLFNRGQSQQKPNIPTTQARPTQPIRRPEEEETQTTEQRSCANDGRDCYPTDNSACALSKDEGNAARCDFPAWLTTAASYLGLYEGHRNGDKDRSKKYPSTADKTIYNEDGENKKLLEMWKSTENMGVVKSYKTYGDKAAWCGVFIHWCLINTINMKETLKQNENQSQTNENIYYESTGKTIAELKAQNTKPIAAMNWKNWGEKSDYNLGAVMVIRSYYTGTDGKRYARYHVTFCVGRIVNKDGKIYYLGLGGNQDQRVKISCWIQDVIVAVRLPKGYRPCKQHKNLDNTPWVQTFINENPNWKNAIKIDGDR